MPELPNPLNVGNPNIPARSEYLLRLVGQRVVSGTDRLIGNMRQAIFEAYFKPHLGYPVDLVPYTKPVERPMSGGDEHMAYVVAIFSPTGEVLRARVLRPQELPKTGKRSRH